MSLDPGASCPRCGAVRVAGPECPRCGVIYAKARPRAPLPAPAAPAPGGPAGDEHVGDARAVELLFRPPAVWTGDVDDARRELWIRAVAPPAALVVTWLLVSTNGGHFFVRTFLSMWVHEIGHAVSAWLCGHAAFPGPWRTPISEGRVTTVVVVVAAAFLVSISHGWRTRRTALLMAGAAGLVAQLVCTALPRRAADALFTFGGDAGAMVIGAALFATIWADPHGRLGRGSLRWGFLGIGAAALVDPLHTWLAAWRDPRHLPIGEIEGVGLSDASRLMENHGWSASALSGRYVALGFTALAVLAIAYVVALRRAQARLRAAEAAVAS